MGKKKSSTDPDAPMPNLRDQGGLAAVARMVELQWRAEAAAPKRCFTMSCYDYSLDTGKGRGGIEGYYRPLPDV